MDYEDEYKILDNDWIQEFEKIDKDYESFYAEDLQYVKLQCIYINKLNEIDCVKEEKIIMNEVNYISREHIIGILKKKSFNNNKRYNILSLLKYNIDIEPANVKHFLKSPNDTYTFLTSVKNIDAIPFKKSIHMFHDLNDLIIIFYEKYEENNMRLSSKKNQTKKVYIKHSDHKKTYKHVIGIL